MPRLRYNPYERRSLDNLSEAIGSGLSGETAYDIFSGIQGGALERLAAARARRQDLLSMLPQMADFAYSTAQAGAPSELVSSAYGGFRSPMVRGALESLLGSLYPMEEAGPATVQGSPGTFGANAITPGGDPLMQLARPAVSPYAADTTTAAATTPFFDEQDQAAVRSAVETAWGLGLREPDQIVTYITQALGQEGQAATSLIQMIVKNTVSRLQQQTGQRSGLSPVESTAAHLFGAGAGAVGGAALGAGIGSLLPGPGTVIGAGLGGLLGATGLDRLFSELF